MMASSPRPIVASPSNPTDWWMLDIRMKMLEFIYHVVVTLGVESALLDSSSLDSLVDDPKLDSAIHLVYRRLRLPGSQGDPPHRTPTEWHQDKRKILECLVPIHQGQPSFEPVVDAVEIQQFTTHQAPENSYEPWATLGITTGYTKQQQQRLLQPYHTPQTPGNLLDRDRAPSETGTVSDNTVTLGDSQAPFSPAHSVSRGRRKRSTSSMQNDKPEKRTRGGPQDHVCSACGKKFPFLSKLKDHLKTHSSEKGLGCNLCPKKFKRAREVNAHLKSVHKIDIQNTDAPAPSVSSHSHSPLSMNPATPASPHPSAFPPTPGSSSSYQPHPPPLPPPPLPPRPSPRSTLLPLSGSYPSPGLFDESTPTSTVAADCPETPAAYTPHGYQSYDDNRMHDYRETSHRGDAMEGDDGGSMSAARDSNSPENLADRVERMDMNHDELKLPPLRSFSSAPTPQNPQTQQEPLPSIEQIHFHITAPAPAPAPSPSPAPAPALIPAPVPSPSPIPALAPAPVPTEAEAMSPGDDPETEASPQPEFRIPTPESGQPLSKDTQAGIKEHEKYVLMQGNLS